MQQAYTTNIQKASNIAATLCDSLLPYLSFLLLTTLLFRSQWNFSIYDRYVNISNFYESTVARATEIVTPSHTVFL